MLKIEEMDFEKDRRLYCLINGMAIVILIASYMLFRFMFPDARAVFSFLPISLFILSCFLYLILHELCHGLFIRILTGSRPRYGIRLPYLFASSPDFIAKSHHIVIALAPAVCFFMLLLSLSLLLPRHAWFTNTLNAINLSGSAGDFFVAWYLAFKRREKGIFVKDDGVSFSIYLKLERLLIVSGRRNGGKTTACWKLAGLNEGLDGIITKKDEEGRLYTFFEIRGGGQYLFLEEGEDAGSSRFGRFIVHEEALEKASGYLCSLTSPVILVDEVGRMELEGGGFYPVLVKLLEKKSPLVLSVRREFVQPLLSLLSPGSDCIVLYVD